MDTIRISGISPNSVVDGPGIRKVIWFSGCEFGCKGCHNEWLQDPNAGYDISLEDLAGIINQEGPVDKITFSGGDPLYQIKKLNMLLSLVEDDKDIWLYTGFNVDFVKTFLDTYPNLNKVKVFKCGTYIESSQYKTVRFRGSYNQRFYRNNQGVLEDISDRIDGGDY